MEFTIKERFLLGASLENLRGNFARLRILRKLREEFSFTEEEFGRFELQIAEGSFRWNPAKEELKEIEIGEEARNIIVERLRELNREGNLIDDHLDVLDKFPEVEDAE